MGEVAGHHTKTFGVAFLDILGFLGQWPRTSLTVIGIVSFYMWYMSRRRKYLTAKVRLKEEKIKTGDRGGFVLVLALLFFLFLFGSYVQWREGKNPNRKPDQAQGTGR
ncbi:MAG: hypothetical protein AAB787_00880 [Patescibacteria group bacterium]